MNLAPSMKGSFIAGIDLWDLRGQGPPATKRAVY